MLDDQEVIMSETTSSSRALNCFIHLHLNSLLPINLISAQPKATGRKLQEPELEMTANARKSSLSSFSPWWPEVIKHALMNLA